MSPDCETHFSVWLDGVVAFSWEPLEDLMGGLVRLVVISRADVQGSIEDAKLTSLRVLLIVG